MTFSKLVARQLGNPSGITSKIAAFVWNRRNAALNDAVFDLLALESFDRVLEIGFGGGYLIASPGVLVSCRLQNAERSLRQVVPPVDT
jgi:hypothetical protein